jgi:hypothetical protein
MTAGAQPTIATVADQVARGPGTGPTSGILGTNRCESWSPPVWIVWVP